MISMYQARLRRNPDTSSGARGQQTVDRVLKRARRILTEHPAWVEVSGDVVENLTVLVSSRGAGCTFRDGDGKAEQLVELRYEAVVPGSAARKFGEQLRALLSQYITDQLEAQRAVSSRLTRDIERLASDLLSALEDNESLREQLQSARIDIDFLRRQVDNLTEAARTGRPGIMRAMVAAVAAILFAATTGIGEAAGGLVIDRYWESPDSSAGEYLERCSEILDEMDALGADRLPRPARLQGDDE